MIFSKLGISSPLLRAIEEMGYETPTPIQEKVIPLLLGKTRDIIALAQTGSGKTATFGLPILQNIDVSCKQPQSLILAPTRELCVQISRDIASYAKYIPDINIIAVYGGASIEEQIETIQNGVHIVVATPGRLLDLLRRGALSLSRTYDVILDEADEMLNMGFSDDIEKILDNIPTERHLLLFSATMPQEIRKIISKYMRHPEEVSVGNKQRVNTNIRHLYYVVASADKYLALKRIVDYYPNIYGIVFCKTRRSTQEIAAQLIQDGYPADALHGDLSQAQRDNVMSRFRNGVIQLLVATDMAARGLDVDNLTHIIHYGLPAEVELYTHRSGRTARAGKKGISIAICHSRERAQLRRISELSGIRVERAMLPTAEEICEKQLQQLVYRMEHTLPDSDAIAPYMDEVINRLSWLDSDDILQRLVYLEIQRMLDYYQNASAIEEIPESNVKKSRKSVKHKNKATTQQYNSGLECLEINLGKKDRLYPNILIDLINHCVGRSIQVGKINVFNKNTTFEVRSSNIDEVQYALNQFEYLGRPIKVSKYRRKK